MGQVMDEVKVEIWTGFGPHPELDISNPYNKALYELHKHVVKLIRKACVGSIYNDFQTGPHTWTEQGWCRERY